MTDLTALSDSLPAVPTVRVARPGDFEAIRQNHRITFDEHAAREPDFNEDEPFIDTFLADLARPFAWARGIFARERVFALVAEVDGTAVGHIAYTRYSNGIGPYAAVVCDLSVDSAHRRTGLGRRLVEAMERREARDGVTGFAAAIWPRNHASQHLFTSLGYTPFETTGPQEEPTRLVQKSIEFGTIPFAVLTVKSVALTLFVIAALYLLATTFFG